MADEREPDGPGTGALRVGDAERRAVDARLQHAHGEGRLTLVEYEERAAQAWAARTRGELDALTHDLPAGGPLAAAVVPAGSTAEALAPTGAPVWLRRLGRGAGVAALAGVLVFGAGRLVTADDGAAVFSERPVSIAEGQDRVELGVLFGSFDVVVPDDVRVVTTGTTVFGSVDCEAACDGPGAREVTIDVSGAFGSADIRTQSEAAAELAEDQRDDGDRRDRDRDDDD